MSILSSWLFVSLTSVHPIGDGCSGLFDELRVEVSSRGILSKFGKVGLLRWGESHVTSP